MELDLICTRYGQFPSEVLKQDAREFQFNLLTARIGFENDAKNARKQKGVTRGR